MKRISDRLKKKNANRMITGRAPVPADRLIVEKARWRGDAASPAVLMIDDLANAWHSSDKADFWDRGGDWGGGLDRERSAYRFILDELLADHPEVKVTFFAVAGKTSHYSRGRPFTFSEPLDQNEETINFFRKLGRNARFEVAYHGYNHGSPGETTEEFVQEWEGFESVDEACAQTNKGREIFKTVFGAYPAGGKYGGWKYNQFSDESIDRSGFIWWCRDWMPRDTSGRVPDAFYEPQFFGENMVVALPSTVHGFLWKEKQIRRLLEKRQIISIEEHIAPVRPDQRIQTPNISDDCRRLRRLFSFLRGRDVWWATGSEVAGYFTAWSRSIIHDVGRDGFGITYDGMVEEPELTLVIDCSTVCTDQKPLAAVTLPDGRLVKPSGTSARGGKFIFMFDLPVINGRYSVGEMRTAQD